MTQCLRTTCLLLAAMLFGVSGIARQVHEILDHTPQVQTVVHVEHQHHAHHGQHDHHSRSDQPNQPSQPAPLPGSDQQHNCAICQSLVHLKNFTLHQPTLLEAHAPTSQSLPDVVLTVRSITSHRLPPRRGPPSLSV